MEHLFGTYFCPLTAIKGKNDQTLNYNTYSSSDLGSCEKELQSVLEHDCQSLNPTVAHCGG